MMRYHESLFEEYLAKHDSKPLHPKIAELLEGAPAELGALGNVILYGPPGIGKYTHALSLLRRYSPTDMKYEKKMSIASSRSKSPIILKISDVHFEVDMSLLGCNSRILWNEIYHHIADVVLSRRDKAGIILCKNFQDIHSELLDIFYSYMQTGDGVIDLTFVLVTEHISFIPTDIVRRCKVIPIGRATRAQHRACFGKQLHRATKLSEISNLKTLMGDQPVAAPLRTNVCRRIAHAIVTTPSDYARIREELYALLVYNLDVHCAAWDILKQLVDAGHLRSVELPRMLAELWDILHLYNNNYRPIYHLERFAFYLISVVHGHVPSGPKDPGAGNIILSPGAEESIPQESHGTPSR